MDRNATSSNGEIFGLPATNALVRKADLCWADAPQYRPWGWYKTSDCRKAAVREGLCAEHYRDIFGRDP